MLRIASSTAEAIDDYVGRRCGFRLSDLTEVALSYSDQRMEATAPHWPSGDRFSFEEQEGEDIRDRALRIRMAPALVTDAEVQASGEFSLDGGWIARCSRPKRAARAWQWATMSEPNLRVNLNPGGHTLYQALAVEGPNAVYPVPASFVLNAVGASMGHLAGLAARDPASLSRAESLTSKRLFRVLAPRTPADSTESPSEDAGKAGGPSGLDVDVVLLPGSRHAFAIAIVGALSGDQLVRALDEADLRLAAVSGRSMREAGVPLAHGGVVRRLVVYGGPISQIAPNVIKPGTQHFHVEELAGFALEAEQDELGIDLVWQFLDEVTSLPGIEELYCWDLYEIWRFWRRYGVVNATGAPITLMVSDEHGMDSWDTSASWEPIEEMLAASGLPPISEWFIAEHEGAGQARLWDRNGYALHVVADPPLIVTASLGKELPALGIDPAFALGIADGVRLTCSGSALVANAIRQPNDCPLMVRLGFTVKRPPSPERKESSEGTLDEEGPLMAIGVRLLDAESPTVDILLGPDWLESLANDTELAHDSLGHAVIAGAGALAGHRVDDKDWKRSSAEAMTAWHGMPPVAALRARETGLTMRGKGHVRLPRSGASMARANRMLAQTIFDAHVTPGHYVGDEAKTLCQTVIAPLMESVLDGLAAHWSEDALVEVAEHLNDACAERARYDAELEMALSAPWADNWVKVALDPSQGPGRTRPLELLLEWLLARRKSGAITPDQFEIAEAADFAELMIHIGTVLAGYQQGLNSMSVIVFEGGVTVVESVPHLDLNTTKEPRFPHRQQLNLDVAAYLQADLVDRRRVRNSDRRLDADTDEPKIFLDRHNTAKLTEFRRLKDLVDLGLSPKLVRASDAIKEWSGTGYDGVHAVLGTAATLGPDDHVQRTSLNVLRAEAIEWSNLDASEIEAAVSRLIMERDGLGAEGLRYWEQERRHQRLTVRPLLAVNDEILVMPWLAATAQELYLRYLEGGRWPWPAKDTPPSVLNALNDWSSPNSKLLETEAEDVVKRLRLPYLKNILPHSPQGLALGLKGELDLLIADADRGRIWVCEVKDSSLASSPRMVRERLDRFWATRGYFNKLEGLRNAVEEHRLAVSRYFDLAEPLDELAVTPLFITRRVSPAAFVVGVSTLFVVVEDLASLLGSPRVPQPGYFNARLGDAQ
jgi:hypothetical protein